MHVVTTIISILTNVVLISAFLFGLYRFFGKKSPLYFRILTLAAGCYAIINLFRWLYYFCYPDADFPGMGITAIGYFGCFSFLLSAGYGQFDSLVDEGKSNMRFYRIAALAAPAVVLFLMALYLVPDAEGAGLLGNVISVLGYLPAVPASYFNFKHAIMPDDGSGFVRGARVSNICAFAIESCEVIKALIYAGFGNFFGSIASLVIAILFALMLVLAERGRKLWSV